MKIEKKFKVNFDVLPSLLDKEHETKRLDSIRESASDELKEIDRLKELDKKDNDLINQKCFNCNHSINQHNFSHKSECRANNCSCEGFIFEKRKCNLCDIIVGRNNIPELMLNPQIQLIPLCRKHFKYEEVDIK